MNLTLLLLLLVPDLAGEEVEHGELAVVGGSLHVHLRHVHVVEVKVIFEEIIIHSTTSEDIVIRLAFDHRWVGGVGHWVVTKTPEFVGFGLRVVRRQTEPFTLLLGLLPGLQTLDLHDILRPLSVCIAPRLDG